MLYTNDPTKKNHFELLPLTKDFTYEVVQNWNFIKNDDIIQIEHSNKFIKVPNLGNLITYDSNNFFKVRQYPETNICRFGSAEDSSDESLFNFSMDATFTGANYGVKKK